MKHRVTAVLKSRYVSDYVHPKYVTDEIRGVTTVKAILSLFAGLGVLAIGSTAAAGTGSMRCGGDIIEAGTYEVEVIAKCGTPMQKDSNRLIYVDGHVVRIVHITNGKVSMIETERK